MSAHRCFASCHGHAQVKGSAKVAQGTVKWFNGQKGYGFIEQADGSKDVFVHVNELAPGVQTLNEGQAVEYEVTQGRKGPQASNVKPV